MSTASWTQTDLDAIETAIARGVRRVEYNDRTVVYASLDEMLKIRSLIRRKLGIEVPSSRIFAETDKGIV